MHRAGNQLFNAFAVDALQGYSTDSCFGRNLLIPHRVQNVVDLPALASERFNHRAETVDEIPLQITGGLR